MCLTSPVGKGEISQIVEFLSNQQVPQLNCLKTDTISDAADSVGLTWGLRSDASDARKSSLIALSIPARISSRR
jgi:hypothetical protein